MTLSRFRILIIALILAYISASHSDMSDSLPEECHTDTECECVNDCLSPAVN